jgi:hypothetical protein
MAFCANCGEPNNQGNYCPDCGASLTTAETSSPRPFARRPTLLPTLRQRNRLKRHHLRPAHSGLSSGLWEPQS